MPVLIEVVCSVLQVTIDILNILMIVTMSEVAETCVVALFVIWPNSQPWAYIEVTESWSRSQSPSMYISNH